MKVLCAEVLGFCMGVRRAIENAELVLKENAGKPVYSLGPLIHNDVVLNDLESKGLKILSESAIEAIEKGSIVIIRAHGVAPQIYERLNRMKCKIVDCTCPRVMQNQKKCRAASESGATVFMAGDKNHGEVKGIEGFASGRFYLFQNYGEAERFDFEEYLKSPASQNAILLSQTTFSQSEYQRISNILLEKIPSIQICNTICPATKQRQDALEKMRGLVDGIAVIGGKKSANSLRLYEKARQICSNSIFIESAAEIPADFSCNSVGITAGASTPDRLVEEVKCALLHRNA